MNVYLESSALLRVVLDGPDGAAIRRSMDDATTLVTSALTLAEVSRVMMRLRASDAAAAALAAPRESAIITESETWVIKDVDEAVLSRCGRAFPREPVRTLDAVHLATVELASGALNPLVVLTTDRRVRSNAAALGFEVQP